MTAKSKTLMKFVPISKNPPRKQKLNAQTRHAKRPVFVWTVLWRLIRLLVVKYQSLHLTMCWLIMRMERLWRCRRMIHATGISRKSSVWKLFLCWRVANQIKFGKVTVNTLTLISWTAWTRLMRLPRRLSMVPNMVLHVAQQNIN